MINSRYYIEKKIGEGRSAVYLCRDKNIQDKLIALKCLPLDVTPEENLSFNNEYKLLRRLEHPSIINVLSSGVILEKDKDDPLEEGSRYFTLEYFPGDSPLTLAGCKEELLISFIRELCSALFYLHQSRIIFYDLKAENVLINISGDEVNIRLIDFGLAHYNLLPAPDFVRGSKEYIAPELLRKEEHDQRVDLYSLGILLYKIVYGNFPFDTSNEMEIYRGHLDKEFIFPSSSYSPKIISIIRRLLEKDPAKRYSTTVEVLLDIDKEIPFSYASSWVPAEIFSNRNDALAILSRYINDDSSADIFTIKGSTGSGKTSLLLKLKETNNNAIYLTYNKSLSGPNFIPYFLNRLLYSEQVFSNLEPDLIKRIKEGMSSSDNIFEEIKSIVSLLLQKIKLVLLIDNLDEADDYVLDLFKNIFPIFQVNYNKVIYSENPDSESLKINLFNTQAINLNPFTEAQVTEYLENSFASFFPVEELKRIILLHADLLPGSIVQFIKDISLLNIIQYTGNRIKIVLDDRSSDFLLNSHDIYRVRIEKLNEEELKAAQILSAIDQPLEESTAAILLNSISLHSDNVLNALQVKNIMQPLYNRNFISISSEGLKSYLYKNIPDKKSFHSLLSSALENCLRDFNRVELARQFQLSENYQKAYEYLYKEISDLLKSSAYSYAKTLLQKLAEFPLDKKQLERIKRDLASVCYNLSSFSQSLEIIQEIENEYEAINDDLLLKASCLIGKGEYESGRDLLKSLLPGIRNDREKRKIFIELANAQYELNNYQEAAEICQLIVENKEARPEELGKCYSLLGLISIFMENEMVKASGYFEKAAKVYSDSGIHFKEAQMEMNLGNIYNIRGDYEKAEKSWNKSLTVFTSIGNLELEGKLQINYGIYHYEKLHYEEAIKYYNRALSIFSSLGNSSGEASVYFNMGELYHSTCEYQKAVDALKLSIGKFRDLKNLNAELESLFQLSKTYFVIGAFQQLKSVMDIMKAKLENDKAVEKNRKNYELLELLSKYNSDDSENFINSLRELGTYFYEQDDRTNYVFVSFLIVNLYYRKGEYSKILYELNNEKLNKVFTENILYEMEKYYWLGLASRKSMINKSSIEYFLKVSEYLLNSSIVELTWKTFLNLAEEFYIRGNLTKAEEYFLYSKSVLEYIFNNSSGEIKEILLNDPARRDALSRISLSESINS